MPAPQASSRPNVAIPISSLLSDTGMNYGPPDGQAPFNDAEDNKPNPQQEVSRKVEEDDNYDEEDETKADTAMQAESTATQATTSATLQPEPTVYKREEDEDYDEEWRERAMAQHSQSI